MVQNRYLPSPARFAREAASLEGEIPLAELDRLQDELAEPEGSVAWKLTGEMVSGRPALRVKLEANPTLVCQRCLDPYVHDLQTEGLIFLARDEAELARWEQEDPLLDGIVVEGRLDVRTLIEDELLLSLPAAPRHDEGECREFSQGAH